MYWKTYLVIYDKNTGETSEPYCEGRCNNFSHAFGQFVLACGTEETARAYIKIYRDKFDTNGDIICAYSSQWNDIKIGE